MKHNWEHKRLKDVCYPKSSIGRASSIYSKDDIIEYIDISSINKDINEIAFNTPYCFGDAPSRAQQCVKYFDVVVSLVRPNLKNIAIVKDDRDNLVASSGFCVLRGKTILPKLIFYIVNSQNFTDALIAKCAGAAYPAVKDDDVKNSIIPVPPMAVQEQIVAELDKINEVIADCRELLRNLDALAQSLFHTYFDNINDTVELSYYVDGLTGGKSLAGKEPSKYKVLKSGAVTYDYFDKTATKFLPLDYTPTSLHEVHVGDLIISRMNTAELVGACAYVFDVDSNCYLPDRLWRIEYNEKANPIFLWYSLTSFPAKEQIRAKASGTSGSMKNISKPLLLSVRIKNAPLSRQNQFALQVERLEEQKKTVEATIAELQTLLDSRMDYWFN